MVPVTRKIDDEDRDAGLRTLRFPIRADGTFTPAKATIAATPDAEIVQYVRIDIEDGLKMTDGTLSAFVMQALNDPQGWGKEGPTVYVQTDGAPDVRIVFASPYTAALICPTPHEPAALTPTAAPSPSPSASASAPVVDVQCATQGTIVVSIYDWIQGVPAYGDDRTCRARLPLESRAWPRPWQSGRAVRPGPRNGHGESTDDAGHVLGQSLAVPGRGIGAPRQRVSAPSGRMWA